MFTWNSNSQPEYCTSNRKTSALVQASIRRSKISREPRPVYSMFRNDDGSPESITRGEMYAVPSNGGAPGSSAKSAVWSWSIVTVAFAGTWPVYDTVTATTPERPSTS